MVDIDPVDHRPIRIRNINLNIFAKDNFIAPRLTSRNKRTPSNITNILNIRNIFI